MFNVEVNYINRKQIFHIDDPLYSEDEIDLLKQWSSKIRLNKGSPIVICTNSYTRDWYLEKSVEAKILVIEQGFHPINLPNKFKSDSFSCVYSSPYIHFEGDKHENHSTWGSELLIREIIPEINAKDKAIEIHLIGQVGENAKKALAKLENICIYGRVDFLENMSILSKRSIGIYPRTFDHKRSILKIYSYIGAGLPIVTFDLFDTKVVKDNGLGFSVTNCKEFVDKIIELKSNELLYNNYRNKVLKFRAAHTWELLAHKMESQLTLL
jgi:hypothetical protein